MRVALAGYGLAGAVFHAPLIAATGGLELVSVLTRSPERALAVAAAHPGARVVERPEELLEDADVLVVATPSGAHEDLARAGLARDLAVIVDKPLAPTAPAARALLAVGGRLTVFHNRRWDDDFLTLRRLLAEDALGPLHRLESRFERFRPGAATTGWRDALTPQQGGGALLDLGPHLVDQALVLLGPAVAVYAELATLRPGGAADDDVFVALEHASGAHSHLWMSALAPLAGPRLRASGARSGFASDGLDPQESQLREGMSPTDPRFGRGRSGRVDAQPLALDPGRYLAFYEEVGDWVRGAAPPPVDPADAVAGLEVLDAARASAARRRVVRLDAA